MGKHNSGIITVNILGDHQYLTVERDSSSSYDKVFEFFDKIIINELNEIGCETWIAGGAIREYFLNKEIKSDVDLYFENEENFQIAKQWFLSREYFPFVDNLDATKARLLLDRPLGEVVLENHATLKIKRNGILFDLVKLFRKDPIETIESFDYTITAAAVSADALYFHTDYFIDLVNRELKINNLRNPLSSLQRMQKYIKYGFTISEKDVFEIAQAIKSTPIAAINPIEFQLDQIENPKGVVAVNHVIKSKKKAVHGSNGIGGGWGAQLETDQERRVRQELERQRERERNRAETISYGGY